MRKWRKKAYPTDISVILNSLLTKKKLKKKIADCKVFEIWDDVAGEKIAEKTEPLELRKGVLKVMVSDHVWLQQLQFLKEEIKDRLNKKLGKKSVENLYFQIGKVEAAKEAEPDIAEELKKVRLTKEERNQIEATLSDCDNDIIKTAAKKAMINAAKRHKLATGKKKY